MPGVELLCRAGAARRARVPALGAASDSGHRRGIHLSLAIRLAVAADAAGVSDLVQRAFAHYVPRIGLRPGPMDADYGSPIEAGEVWVAGEPLVATLVLNEQPDHVWVDVIAVDPAHQARGLGRQLMAIAEDRARTSGVSEVRLLTNELMSENRAFYAHLGYREYTRAVEDEFRRVYLRKRVVAGAN